MKETDELIFGLIIASLGTILNLVVFVSSELEFGFVFNILYLAIPFLVGFSFIIHSMNKTLTRARSELGVIKGSQSHESESKK